jgi:hypothetical protein
MNGKMVKPISIIIISLALLSSFGCDLFDNQVDRYPTGLGGYNDIRYYSFEPEMIFSALEQGQREIFKPSQTHLENNLFPSGSFPWHQEDYLKIFGALNQLVGKDTLEDWELYKMDFDKGCSDNPIGFDAAQITYFKTDGNEYIAREMDVYPLAKEADWGGDTHFPRPFLLGWKSIDLELLKVTADDALQIAEANGGKAARLLAKNKCNILVILSPNTDYENWDVYYYGDSAATIFEINIDSYSGGYRIISDK